MLEEWNDGMLGSGKMEKLAIVKSFFTGTIFLD